MPLPNVSGPAVCAVRPQTTTSATRAVNVCQRFRGIPQRFRRERQRFLENLQRFQRCHIRKTLMSSRYSGQWKTTDSTDRMDKKGPRLLPKFKIDKLGRKRVPEGSALSISVIRAHPWFKTSAPKIPREFSKIPQRAPKIPRESSK